MVRSLSLEIIILICLCAGTHVQGEVMISSSTDAVMVLIL